jgi:drug/metabolite transporter (DMT)-like permease
MLRPTILITLLGPMLWGTTYAVFTETLPVSHPLLVGAMRALPAGLILLALNPRIPPLGALMRHAAIGFPISGCSSRCCLSPHRGCRAGWRRRLARSSRWWWC